MLTPAPPPSPQEVLSPAIAAGARPRLSPRFVFSHPAHAIALGFGSGLSPLAPGTAGTLWGWVSFLVMQLWLTHTQIGVVIGVSLAVGWWACAVTAQHLGRADPGNIVWDEVVAFWIVLWVIAPAGVLLQLMAFALFRFFDAVKPGPVGWADRRFHGLGWRGGLGILLDDLVAACCTLLVIAAGVMLWRWL
jgi:phosphatidylglycerophosphatase A